MRKMDTMDRLFSFSAVNDLQQFETNWKRWFVPDKELLLAF